MPFFSLLFNIYTSLYVDTLIKFNIFLRHKKRVPEHSLYSFYTKKYNLFFTRTQSYCGRIPTFFCLNRDQSLFVYIGVEDGTRTHTSYSKFITPCLYLGWKNESSRLKPCPRYIKVTILLVYDSFFRMRMPFPPLQLISLQDLNLLPPIFVGRSACMS